MTEYQAPPELEAALAKLSAEDKREILRHIVILPMIEEDKSLSVEEQGDAELSGKKMGFTKEEVWSEIKPLVESVGGVIEKE